MSADASMPFTSVVIATRDRATLLRRCLTSLEQVDYPSFEVVVVDNAPTTDDTARLVEAAAGKPLELRYAVEPRPGTAVARNLGLSLARGEIVAFLDDDVLVEQGWLRALVRGFAAAEDVACVTGKVLPVSVDAPEQSWFDKWAGFSKGEERTVYDLGEHAVPGPLYPYRIGLYGTGANAAFKTDKARALGGYDETLGPGTPAKGGEDIDLFLRVILAGWRLVYEPAAVVRHHHSADYRALRRTVHGYGLGASAVMTKYIVDPRTRRDVLRRIPAAALFTLRTSTTRGSGQGSYSLRVLPMHVAGMVRGPFSYLRSRRQLGSRRPVVTPPAAPG
jgi:glycosyltransferase involved in cell wall biosynthesis